MIKEWDIKLNYKSFMYNLRKFLQFSQSEIKAVVISIIIMTFIVAFNDKNDVFHVSSWAVNFFIWLVIVTISFLTFLLGQRAMCLWEGYIPEYRLWWYGLMFGLIISFVSRGHIWLLLPGGMLFHHSTVHRIGEFRHGQTTHLISKISFFGPLASFMLGMAVKTLDVWFGFSFVSPTFVHNLYLFCIALAAFSLLPIPPLPGSNIYFHSRLVYSFVFGAFAGYAILVMFDIYSFDIYSLILAVIIGIVVWALFWIFFEQGGWQFDP